MPNLRVSLMLLLCACGSVPGQRASQTTQPTEAPKADSSAQTSPQGPAKKDDFGPCPAKFDDSLDTNGVTPKVGGDSGITPPRVTYKAETHIPNKPDDPARDKLLAGDGAVILISLVVDVKGRPTELCLRKAAGFGLDEEAFKAVKQYRFTPAKKGKVPVAARMAVEIDLHRY